jgi:hypothetical protein
VRPGEPWGEPYVPDPGTPPVDVRGDDADLATAAARAGEPGAVLRFDPAPTSDLARALGLGPGGPPGSSSRTVVACDGLDLGTGHPALNAVVLGVAPDRLRPWHRRRPVVVEVDGRAVGEGRATTVVVASGQFLRGRDLVPRGHPGDGRIEVQVYALAPGERRAMGTRVATGAHVPHPRIAQASGRRVVVRWVDGPRTTEVDGHPAAPLGEITVAVRPAAARVLL